MKYNLFGYLIGEGFSNILKNKKSTSASIIIMCATMFIFGGFLIISQNINYFINEIQQEQGMQVFVKAGTTAEQLDEIEKNIRAIGEVSTVEFVSKEKALNIMKERFPDTAELLEPYEGENNIFTESYIIKLVDLESSGMVKSQIEVMENIKTITSSDETIDALVKIATGIRVFTGVILIILVLISIFIISNTIKLTVHARRKEISIMKYVGATNWFIRWPFIVEGIIIGIIASSISIGVVAGAYTALFTRVVNMEIMKQIGLELIAFNVMFSDIIMVYMVLGIGIGVLRKYNVNEKISKSLKETSYENKNLYIINNCTYSSLYS